VHEDRSCWAFQAQNYIHLQPKEKKGAMANRTE
jgi:hypothetical protein